MKSFFAALIGAIIGATATNIANNYFYRHTAFEIVDRAALPYGVPVVRSGRKYGENRPTAFDILPRGNPSDEANSGKAWFDVCNADIIENPNSAVSCIYAGAWADKMFLGTRSFNGAPTVPLYLRIGNLKVGELSEAGLKIYGDISAHSFKIDTSR
jgi:hypothetical protein